MRNRRVAEGTEEEVPYEEIVKGYEISPDRYVVMTREELSKLDPKKTRSIEIQDFVEIGEIDPIYFENPYYLGPAEGAEKAYSLLAEAMESSGKAAIARFVLRNREHLAAIRAIRRGPDDDHDALRRRGRGAGRARGRPSAVQAEGRQRKEVEMAEKLIDSLAGDFDPSSYRDEYREELLSLIEQKAEGKEVVSLDLGGAGADQGARPDGGAGGEHRRGPRLGPGAGEAEATLEVALGLQAEGERQVVELQAEGLGLEAQARGEVEVARSKSRS